MSSTIGVDAPINDLEHYKNLLQYKKIDAEVADTALKKFYLHLWYLTQELVVLSLFSNKVDSDTKSHIAAKLVSTEKLESFDLGKPDFPQLDPKTVLPDLIGPLSWTLFEVLNVETEFLTVSPDKWMDYPGYVECYTIARNMKVVNDTAERGVKLISEFLTTTTKEESQLQYLLQAVEAHRDKFPNFNKKNINE